MASDAEVPQDATKEDVLILRLPPALAEGVREKMLEGGTARLEDVSCIVAGRDGTRASVEFHFEGKR